MLKLSSWAKFDKEKAIEVIIYLTKNSSNPTMHSILKLLYLADKTKLERFGSFICDDSYSAMPEGPVPSNVYDLLKHAKVNDRNGFVVENNKDVKALRDADLDKLSDADIECLDLIIARYGNAPYWERKRITHDEAYDEAWNKRGDKNSVPMSIESIARMLEDADDLVEYLECRYDD